MKSVMDSIREQIRIALEESNANLFIQTPPGSGKSTELCRWFARLDGCRFYIVPFHRLGDEILARLREFGLSGVPFVTGRSPKSCWDFAEIKKLTARGYPASLACQTCLKVAQKGTLCPFKKRVKAALSQGGPIVCTPGVLPLLLEQLNPKVMVLDEKPQKLVEVKSFRLELLDVFSSMVEDDDPELADALRRIARILRTGHKLVLDQAAGKGPYKVLFLSGRPMEGVDLLWEVVDSGKVQEIIEKSLESGLLRELLSTPPGRVLGLYGSLEEPLPIIVAKWLESLVYRHGFVMVRPAGVQCVFSEFVVPPERLADIRLVVADASLTPRMLQHILPLNNFAVIKSPQKPNLKAVLLYGENWSKTALSRSKSPYETAMQAFEEVIKAVKECKVKALVCSYRKLMPQILEVVRKHLGDGAYFTHYFSDRSQGTNDFRTADCIIAFLPPVQEPLSARVLFKTLGMLPEEEMAELEALNAAHLKQLVYRIRPLDSPKPKLAILIGSYNDLFVQKALGISAFDVLWFNCSSQGKTPDALSFMGILLKHFGFCDPVVMLLVGVGLKGQIPPAEFRKKFWQHIAQKLPDPFAEFAKDLELLQGWNSIKGAVETIKHLLGNQGDPEFSPALYKILYRCREKIPHLEKSQEYHQDSPTNFLPDCITHIKKIERLTSSIKYPTAFEILGEQRIEFRKRDWWGYLVRRYRKLNPDIETYKAHMPGELRDSRRGRPTVCLGDSRRVRTFYEAALESGLLKEAPEVVE